MKSLHKHLLINVSITTQRKKTKTKQNKKQTSKQNKTNKHNYKNSPRQTELYINKKEEIVTKFLFTIKQFQAN